MQCYAYGLAFISAKAESGIGGVKLYIKYYLGSYPVLHVCTNKDDLLEVVNFWYTSTCQLNVMASSSETKCSTESFTSVQHPDLYAESTSSRQN